MRSCLLAVLTLGLVACGTPFHERTDMQPSRAAVLADFSGVYDVVAKSDSAFTRKVAALEIALHEDKPVLIHYAADGAIIRVSFADNCHGNLLEENPSLGCVLQHSSSRRAGVQITRHTKPHTVTYPVLFPIEEKLEIRDGYYLRVFHSPSSEHYSVKRRGASTFNLQQSVRQGKIQPCVLSGWC